MNSYYRKEKARTDRFEKARKIVDSLIILLNRENDTELFYDLNDLAHSYADGTVETLGSFDVKLHNIISYHSNDDKIQ